VLADAVPAGHFVAAREHRARSLGLSNSCECEPIRQHEGGENELEFAPHHITPPCVASGCANNPELDTDNAGYMPLFQSPIV
jgi:hypothetical protein